MAVGLHYKMNKDSKVLIIGYGSIGKKHFTILNRLILKKNIYIFSNRKIKKKNFINKNELKRINPDYLIICSKTSDHFKDIKMIEKNFKNKKVLIEKPIFHKYFNLPLKKNKYFVNYQLRFHPIIQKLKMLVNKSDKKLNLQINCNSYLPNWRKKSYRMSYSSDKKYGGGVLLDLSHEIDYFLWLFSKAKILYWQKTNISNLNIKSNDLGVIAGKFSTNGYFSINLSYFSKIERRDIYLDTNNYSFYGNFIKNYYKINTVKKTKTKYIKIDQLKLIQNVHKKILNNNFKDICTVEEGLKTLKFIEKLKN